ncbi:MAG: hypothetical protein COX77_02625 [Candidatus Komeilibacteria bacterium CG_4_10_14_0_2_um_filter_37_10]|uniref:Valine--tRNA ligase n=1 Tax=Candidatus Komeilibacteria bacterium CG_4_10_14_0_2_um_filter_37_10 TaxID=1974470 RepID=A0A2M7VEW5_9BACT|nr:MAG: hypothetical protein COX77_02625 [Candidatus Komeilibacteria bacterium CG_4_10_14_0_2_um_filter_37_10]
MEMPKNYSAGDYEQSIYQQWEESGFFNPDNLTWAKKPFSIVLPPPNATGILHLGHASMLAYQDVLIRYHRLLGEKTLWLPGTDHAAIATQNVVEKKIAQEENLTKEQLRRNAFLARVRNYVANSQNTIHKQLRAMGSSLDWSRERYTLDDGLSRVVTTAFKKMYDDGLICRGYRIVNWCPRCQSTLADDEVEYKIQKTHLYYLQYGPVVIATTRPETKIGDTGLAVNPHDQRYQHLIGQTLKFSLGDIELSVKCFADESVDPEFGTGAIGVTPAHSTIDYDWAQKYDLAIVKIIDERGNMTKEAGAYADLLVTEARKKFLLAIEQAGQLIKIENYENNLSVCYRCGTAIEPLPSEQWFVDVNKKIPKLKKSLKELSLAVVEKGLADDPNKKIVIIPENFTKVYLHWMTNLHDWCISRQIWWGHRIPIWYCLQCGKISADNEPRSKWFLVRHGETDMNKENRLYYQDNDIDMPLNEQGIMQAEECAQELKKQKIDLIITSHYLRAQQTAQVIARVTGAKIILEENFRERNTGNAQGMTSAEVKTKFPNFYEYADKSANQENYQEMEERMWESFSQHYAQHKDKNVVIVGHGGAFRSLIRKIKNIDPVDIRTKINLLSNSQPFQLDILQPCSGCHSHFFEQDPDTLDTWFSSALWSFSTLMNGEYHGSWQEWLKNSPDLQKYHPLNVMETGYDILFFWVARMILMTTYLINDIPFQTVYLHGLIRDKQGRKMSKSLGNGVDPIVMIEKYGADALRLAILVGATPGNDTRLYDEKIEGYRNFINKLWNISRYIFNNTKSINIIKQQPKPKTAADHWIINELNLLITAVSDDLNSYRFSLAIEKLYEFTWSKFADWYLEISKIEKNKEDILLYILQTLLKLWHPFAPFVTEVLWQKMSSELIMVEKWPVVSALTKIDQSFQQLQEIINKIRSAKAENKIDQVKIIDLYLAEQLDTTSLQIISQLGRVNIVQQALDNWLTLPLSNNLIKIAIDRDEAEQIHRSNINQLQNNISSQRAKLANEQFINNAPLEIIEEERKKLTEAEKKLAQIS